LSSVYHGVYHGVTGLSGLEEEANVGPGRRKLG
jgi:hypothetical protein